MEPHHTCRGCGQPLAANAPEGLCPRCLMAIPLAATRCGHAFFGTGRCLFATDAPFDAEQGRGLIARTISAVEALEIGSGERARILSTNARDLLNLH